MKFSDTPYFLLKNFLTYTYPVTAQDEPILLLWNGVDFVSRTIDTINISPSTSGVYTSGAPAYESDDFTTVSDMTSAADIGGVFFYDYAGAEWYSFATDGRSTTSGGYLVGANEGIYVGGDGIYTLYVENTIEDDALTDKQKGFVPINFSSVSINENEININVHNISESVSSALLGQIVGSNPSGGYFDIYDTASTDVVNISNSKKVYFRKDSFFHDWLADYATSYFYEQWGLTLDIRNFINTDKTFVYLGQIYPTSNEDSYNYRVIYEGLKDYVSSIPPYHQRTPRFLEMLEIYFDRIYHSIYTKQKDILTLHDPMEVDFDYLGYISRYYGMNDLENIISEPQRYREFVRDTIHLLKRKGTFSDLYVIWKALIQSENYLNVYERWLPQGYFLGNSTSAVVLEDDWEDHLYVNRDEYGWELPTDGVGTGWYFASNTTPASGYTLCDSEITSSGLPAYPLDRYDMSDKILSSNYRVELDINKEPITVDSILPKDVSNDLFTSFEFVRPVYRNVKYGIVFAPIVDFTGQLLQLYSNRNSRGEYYNNVYAQSQSVAINLAEIGAYIGVECTPSTTWTFEHNLYSYRLMSQFFDTNFHEIVPDTIEYSSDGLSATATFGEPQNGYMFLKIVDDYRTKNITTTTNFLVHHDANDGKSVDNTVLVQFVNRIDPNDSTSNYQRLTVDDVQLQGQNSVFFDVGEENEDMGDVTMHVGSNETVDVFTFTSPSTTWTIDHNLLEKGLMVSCYSSVTTGASGTYGTQIYPESLKLIDENQTVLTFGSAVAGVVAIMKVGNPDVYELLVKYENGIQVSPIFKVIGPLVSEASDEEKSQYSEYTYTPNINNPSITEQRLLYDSGLSETFYSDNEYFYSDFGITYENECEDIQIIEVLNNDGVILFRTETSGIYKQSNVDFNIHYKISVPSI